MSWQHRDINAVVLGKVAFAATDLTAAGAGDATEIDGIAYDREDKTEFPNGPPESGVLYVAASAVLGSGDTLSIAANWQHSPSTTQSWTDVGTAVASTVIATGPSGGGTVHAEIAIPLSGPVAQTLDKAVRVQVTPDLSRAGTDTASIGGVLVFGGERVLD